MRDELSVCVENLDASAAVFADVDVSLTIDRDAARVSHHAWADAFAAELQRLADKAVAHFAGARTDRFVAQTSERDEGSPDLADRAEHAGEHDDDNDYGDQNHEPERFGGCARDLRSDRDVDVRHDDWFNPQLIRQSDLALAIRAMRGRGEGRIVRHGRTAFWTLEGLHNGA